MDRDVRKMLVVCGVSVGVTALLLALRLDGKTGAAGRTGAAQPSRSAQAEPAGPGAGGTSSSPAGIPASAPRRISLTDRQDVAMSQFAAQAWSGDLADEEIDPEDKAADAEEDADPEPEEPAGPRKRWRKGQKRKPLTAEEIAQKVQDPEDSADDGKEDAVDPDDENSRAEHLETASDFKAAMAAEDRDEDDEPEDELLGGGK